MKATNIRDYPYGLLDSIFPGDEIFFSEDVVQNIEKAIAGLSEIDRQLILLRYRDKMKIQDIGEIVGFTQGTVSAKIQSVIALFRHPVGRQQILEGKMNVKDYSLENYHLSSRTYNALRRNGIWSLDQIQSVKHLQQMRTIGKGTIQEILDVIKENGFYLRKG